MTPEKAAQAIRIIATFKDPLVPKYMKLPATMIRELKEAAARLGVTETDLVRVALFQLLTDPELV